MPVPPRCLPWLSASALALAFLPGCSGGGPVSTDAPRRADRAAVTVALLPVGDELAETGGRLSPTGSSLRGRDTYARLFDLILADATADVVVRATDPDDLAPAGAPSAGADGPLFSVPAPGGAGPEPLRPLSVQGRRPDLLLLIHDLEFAEEAEADRMAIGSLVEGRRFLDAVARYTLYDNRTLAPVKSGEVRGRAVTAQTGLSSWQAYASSLEALARRLVADAGLSPAEAGR